MMAMMSWKSLVSVTRQYTCLVVPRNEVYLRLRACGFHNSPVHRYIGKEKSLTKKGVQKSIETQVEQGMGVITVLRKDELQPGVIFPSKETATSLIDGVKFDEIPILHVKATKNNTTASCDKYDGGGICMASAGQIGFKNARKGTNVAAQAVGVHLGDKLLRRGVDKVRVIVKGIGIGRLPCLKGIQLAGVNIVSITDNTPVYNGKRPRSARRT